MGKRGLLFWLVLLVWSVAVPACGGPSSSPDRLQIDPPSATIDFDAETVLHAQAFAGTEAQDAGPTVTWVSRDPAKVQVTKNADGSATVKGLAAGGTTIVEAHLDELVATASITVGAAPIASIGLTPPNPSLALGTTQQLTATAMFADATTGDVTDSATWTSMNPAIATVTADGVVRGVTLGSTTIRAAQDGVTGMTMVTITAAQLTSIAVMPTNPTVIKGRTVQLTATGTFTNNTTQNLTPMVTWSSANDAVVTVTNTGLGSGANVGAVMVTATLDGVMGSTLVTVSPATLTGLAVTPVNPSVPRGRVQQFTATGTFSDGSTDNLTTTVTWSSTNQVIASVSNGAGTNGQATANDPGTSIITASTGAFIASQTMTVTPAVLATIQVTPATPSIAAGRSQQFTATGIFTDMTMLDLTQQVGWSSSNEAAATVSNAAGSRGLATAGNAAGNTIITATSGLITGTAALTVTAADLVSITVTPVNPSLAKGRTRQLTAMGTFSNATTLDLTSTVTWTSTVPGNATIANAAGSQGLATAVAVGPTQIRAASGAVSGSTLLTVTAAELVSIGVTPAAPSVAKGRTQQFIAMGVFTDATMQDITTTVTWSSTAPLVASISNAAGSRGLASTLIVGVTNIQATSGLIVGGTELTVTPAVLVSIGITPADPSLSVGRDLQLTATGVFSDTTHQDLTDTVTWASSDALLARISNAAGEHGLVSGLAAGTVQITATSGAIVGTIDLDVTNAVLESIEVTPLDDSVAAGRELQFTATGIYSDGTNADITDQVTWTSSDDAIAVVSNDAGDIGRAYTSSAGAVTITATSGLISNSADLTVTDAELDSIEVTPSDGTLAAGLDQQYTATGVYSDGSTDDLTTQVTWSSSDEGVVTIANAAEIEGLAHGETAGVANISADLDGVTGTTQLEVTAAILTAITVDPALPTVVIGLDQQFTATGTFSDGSTLDITDQVTWTSDADEVATISNAGGSNGLATGTGVGTVTITAELDGVSADTELTVAEATLQSIEVTPSDFVLALGVQQQFTATGAYDNGTFVDITTSVTWSSSDGEVASVDNGANPGLVTGEVNGDTTISATQDGVTGQTALHVTDALLVAVEVSPTTAQLPLGLEQQFTAQAIYSDATIIDVTAQATWSSTSDAVATVSNAGGSQGLVTSHATGTTVLTAAFGNLEAHADLEITAAVLDSITIEPIINPGLPVGLTRQYAAIGLFTDATTADLTTQVTWGVNDDNLIVVSNAAGSQGLATGLAVGDAVITATLDGVEGSTALEITAAVVVSIEVTPADTSVAAGVDPQFIATGTFSDATVSDITEQVGWASDDDAVVTISNAAGSRGLATTHATGTATISATMDGVTGSTSLDVTDAELVAIQVTPTDPSIALGRAQAFVATAVYTDDSTIDVTAQAVWASSDHNVATISNLAPNNGRAASVAPGTTTISATFDGFTGQSDLTVTAAVLDAIAVTPVNPSVPDGRTVQMIATGTYSDGTTAIITNDVVWSTDAIAIAIVSNVAGSRGLLQGKSPGLTAVRATKDGISGARNVTVTQAVLESLTIAPLPASVPVGRTLQLVATGQYSNGTTADLSATATWSTTTPAVLSVSNVAPRGKVTGVASGPGKVKATDAPSGIFKEIDVQVTAAVLDTVVVAPTPTSVTVGGTRQLTATGTYSDASVRNITNDADTLWSTSAVGTATVSNAAGAKGVVTGVALGGPVTITAAQNGKSGTAAVTVATAPTVTTFVPADGATAVVTTTTIAITFSTAMAPATLTFQGAAGACTGAIQVSKDNFASCFAISGRAMSVGDTIATFTPSVQLSYGQIYKVRVTTAAQSSVGVSIAADVTLANGFTTRTDRPCGTGLIISQVFGGGGNSGASHLFDFIELHNVGTAAVSTNGLSVQFLSAAGAGNWAVQTLPAAMVPPGGYFLIQEGGNAAVGAPLPMPDFIPAAAALYAIGGTSGKVALTSNNTALVGASLPLPANVIDVVGFGSGVTTFEGTAGAGAPSNTASVQRLNGGCADGNANNLDFVVAATAPHSSVSLPNTICSCNVNETGLPSEIDFCNIQFPAATSAAVNVATENIFAQVFETGVTEAAGQGAGMACQIGYGSATVNPEQMTSYTWVNGTFNVQVGNNDEFKAALTVAVAGSYKYASRCTKDGTNWTVCDINGAGSNANLVFDLAQLGSLTITP